jgi:hypothetical protein
MAEIGEIKATLSVDTSRWQRGLTQAAQQLSAFQQGLGRMNPAVAEVQRGLGQIGQQAQQMGARSIGGLH